MRSDQRRTLGGVRSAVRQGQQDQKGRQMAALHGEPELAPGIQRSHDRAFWSRRPLGAHADARVIAAG